ncbi:hypothetical protein DFQ10_104162 [Winogradskyella eximia]|uniref:Uncharacterized protein n=1 Tax=Winogradskyella eximia TaxID=262006 RepID=A0A3D9H463_9FLAO|nr:hypothetical protein DFQ10_104162 [Winogradskyella eximia]
MIKYDFAIKTKPTLMVRQGWEKIAMKKKNYR